MGRVMGFFTLAILIGVATGLVLHSVVIGMVVVGGLSLLGILMLIGRTDRPGPEP